MTGTYASLALALAGLVVAVIWGRVRRAARQRDEMSILARKRQAWK